MFEVEQVSVFLENKPGRLGRLTGILGEAGKNVRAFMVAEAGEFGLVRMIVDDPKGAGELLSSKGFVCRITKVLCVEIPDKVGELGRLSGRLAEANLNVDYAYAFMTGGRKAVLVLKLDDQDEGAAVLARHYRLLTQEELANL